MRPHPSPGVCIQPYAARCSAPVFSPETVRHLKLLSPTMFIPSNTSSRISGVSDSCKIISRSRGAILGAIETVKPRKKSGYGNIMSTTSYKLNKGLHCTNSLNCTMNKLNKRIQYSICNKKEHTDTKNKKETTKTLNYSEVCQELETDVSIPLRNIGYNCNQTVYSRNDKFMASQTSEGLVDGRGGLSIKSSWKSSQSNSIGRAIRPISTLAKRESRKYSHQNNVKVNLESEEGSLFEMTPDASFKIGQTIETNVLNNSRKIKLCKHSKCTDEDMKEKFEMTTKCPIETLLRPITEKNRSYQQKEKVKTLASKPYIINKLKNKLGKENNIQKNDKCVIF